MMRRGLLAAMVALGIAICTVADRRALPPPALVDGYYVLGADFHVHVAFGDGGLAPWDARAEARRRGIDVIAIANHNQMLSARLHRRWFDSASLPLVLPGQEVTARDHHIVAVGITRTIDWSQPAAATIAAIHAQGGVAIAAHPGSDSIGDYDAGALAHLDAAERAHPGMHQEIERGQERASEYAEFFARAKQHNPRVSPLGDSDFHFTGNIGVCRTYVLARELTEAGVLDALRNGRAVAVDDEGNRYGDQAHIEIVERAQRTRGAAPSSHWRTAANALGVALVWLGLIGAVILPPAPRRPAA